MATGLTLAATSNLATGQKILIGAAKAAFEPAAPDPDLVESLSIPQGTKQYDVLSYARLASSAALTEGVDLAEVQQLVTATITITPSEHGSIVTLSKRLIRRQSDTSVIATSGTLLANSLRRREALDVIALYDTFTKSVGGTGVTLDVAHFRGSNGYLMTDNDAGYGPAQPPFRAALHIEQISDIILDISSGGDIGGTSVHATTTGFSQELLTNWWKARDRLYGVEVFHSGNIARDASNDSKGALFGKAAINLVHANTAEPTEDEDPSARTIEYGIFQEWGEAVRANVYGVEIFSNSAATV